VTGMQKRLTLLAMCIGQGMILLDVTVVNVALPSIQRQLHESSGDLEWVISAYALSLAALIPLSGTLGDRFGRKRFFAVGMVVFALGSVACALSTTAPELIGARAFQGVGGAIMSALALSILSETYSGETRARAIGIWATVAGLGFGLGPVVGGLLLGVSGWSSVFWVNVPFAVAGVVLTITVVPESRNPDTRAVDVPGVLASAAGLLALTFGLVESSSNSWTSTPVWAPIVAGFVLLAAFVVWEHRASFPMIPAEVVKQRTFSTACGVFLFSYAALTAVYFYLTLLYQDVDGWSALRTGLSWLFLNAPFLVVAQLAGRLNRWLSPRAVVAGGCLVTAAAVITLSTLTRSSPFRVTVIGYVLFGAGTGMWIPGVANVAMRDVPSGLSGTASGVFNASRQVGTSIGLAILGAIGADTARSAWDSHVSHLSGPAQQAAIAQAHNVASAQIGAVTRALGTGQGAAAEQAFSDGYEVAVLVAGLCLIAAALISVFGLHERHRPELGAVGALVAPPGDPDAPALAMARGASERPGSDSNLVNGMPTNGEGAWSIPGHLFRHAHQDGRCANE
jgi:DHA2 family methylenomycin A resistance protein-like MFS transporter